jgi:hypothetical protein
MAVTAVCRVPPDKQSRVLKSLVSGLVGAAQYVDVLMLVQFFK